MLESRLNSPRLARLSTLKVLAINKCLLQRTRSWTASSLAFQTLWMQTPTLVLFLPKQAMVSETNTRDQETAWLIYKHIRMSRHHKSHWVALVSATLFVDFRLLYFNLFLSFIVSRIYQVLLVFLYDHMTNRAANVGESKNRNIQHWNGDLYTSWSFLEFLDKTDTFFKICL